MNSRLVSLLVAFVAGSLLLGGSASLFGDEAKSKTADGTSIVYSKQIAPLLRTYCVGCHSRINSEGGVSLQAPDDILRGGEHGDLLDRQKPVNSRLLAVLVSSDDDHMPPKEEPQPTEAELDLLRKWIEAGAPFDSRAAMLPELPKVVPAKAGRSSVFAMQIDSQHRRLLGLFRRAELRSKSFTFFGPSTCQMAKLMTSTSRRTAPKRCSPLEHQDSAVALWKSR